MPRLCMQGEKIFKLSSLKISMITCCIMGWQSLVCLIESREFLRTTALSYSNGLKMKIMMMKARNQ